MLVGMRVGGRGGSGDGAVEVLTPSTKDPKLLAMGICTTVVGWTCFATALPRIPKKEEKNHKQKQKGLQKASRKL